ncbi:hypothetical protein D081_0032 [Anaerovibrio sp. JC8]|uniref:hypothetical protein n=1 Tax=Anaerovibrio sp. JC8 TaxID=1240085 RepID=UPI000A0BDFD7|nr:hypothetical protein [Anaerovibrio sp. JC8]ORU01213.1 hypothetical protein D081_0032 [Anaerovibrio sp. JC8]
MGKNMVSKISNPFSTGNGGGNFEQRIQAMFLLSLLIDGFCPALNERTKKVCFQAKHLGYDVDDLVVFTYGKNKDRKMLCQIKHSVKVTEKDKTFQEVICAAWSDFCKDSFDKEKDQIALLTAQIHPSKQKALRFIHEQAIVSSDEKDFRRRISLVNYASSDIDKTYNTIENIITSYKGSKPEPFALWRFCKAFILLLFDMDCNESVNRTLSAALIKCNSSMDAYGVWERLVEYAGFCNQAGASIDMNNIDKGIQDLFLVKKLITFIPAPITGLDFFVPTIAMIGAWREDNDFDRQTIKKISGLNYSDFELKAKNMILGNSAYLQLTNGSWKVLHKDEILLQCKEMLFDASIEKLVKATKNVLLQKSKMVMNQNDYCYSVSDEYDNSVELRKSLIESVCWIKKALPDISNCNRNKIENMISLLVRETLQNVEWTRWASLSDCLEYLAELDPECFLDMIEQGIINKPQEILRLFPQKSGLFGTANYITHLLWSLEILAWSPDFLVRSIRILGLLETLSYTKTNWSNTPKNSIISILLPWYPQTVAGFAKRKNALLSLKNENMDIYWDVLSQLLPSYGCTSMNNPRPRYLLLDIPEKINVTSAEISNEYAYLLGLAVDEAQCDVNKIVDLTSKITYMNDQTLDNYLDHIDTCIEKNTKEHIFSLWLNLCESIELIKTTAGKVLQKKMDRFQNLIEKMEPDDIRLKYRELYLGTKRFIDKGDYVSTWQKVETEKSVAVREIFDRYGYEGTEAFGYAVKNIDDVARRLGGSLNVGEQSMIIDACYLETLSKEFTISCLASFLYCRGASEVLATSLSSKDQGFILEMLSKIPLSQELIKIVNIVLTDEYAYWEKAVMPYCCNEADIKFLSIILEKLKSCKRYITAVNLLGRSEFEPVITASDVYNLLILAGTEESIGNESIDSFAIKNIISWFQKQENVDLQLRSDIDFIYLPFIDIYSGEQPRALNTRLSLEPDYFCSMLEHFYKGKSGDQDEVDVNKGVADRLFSVLFQYKVTPGINWDGVFDENIFKAWMDSVKKWSKEHERFEVAMYTVGSGLSYATLDADKFPPMAIVKELNLAENDALRRGYYLGIINQRGAHYVDPEGKPELELSEDYNNRANIVEAKGYSRYADILRKIADEYKREAMYNIEEAQKRIEC